MTNWPCPCIDPLAPKTSTYDTTWAIDRQTEKMLGHSVARPRCCFYTIIIFDENDHDTRSKACDWLASSQTANGAWACQSGGIPKMPRSSTSRACAVITSNTDWGIYSTIIVYDTPLAYSAWGNRFENAWKNDLKKKHKTPLIKKFHPQKNTTVRSSSMIHTEAFFGQKCSRALDYDSHGRDRKKRKKCYWHTQ